VYAGEVGNANPAPIPMKPTARPTWYPVIVAVPTGKNEMIEVLEPLKPAQRHTMRGRGIMIGGNTDPTPSLPTLHRYRVIFVTSIERKADVFLVTDSEGCIPAQQGGATVLIALITSWETQAVPWRASMKSCFNSRALALNG
jgi:hypothetical protein